MDTIPVPQQLNNSNPNNPTTKAEVTNQPVEGEVMEKKPLKIGLGLILGWILGIYAILWGLFNIYSHILLGFLSLISGIIVFPPILNLVKTKLNIELTGGLKWSIYIVLQIIGSFLITQYILQGLMSGRP